MKKSKWILCPICANKISNQIREDSVLLKNTLYFPKCKREVLLEEKHLQVKIIIN